MKNFFSLLIVAATLFVAQGQAATLTLNPTADAYVEFGAPTVNYGVNTELRSYTNTSVGGNLFESYLKFDTSTAIGTITSAKLRLYASLSGSGSVTSSIYAVSNTSWGETAITWDNKPALGAALGSMSVTSTSYAWQEIDVTAYVQSEKAAGRNVISLGLRNIAPSLVFVRADSREASNPPQLVIVSNAAPTVSMSSPANGATFTAPASIALAATAVDSDGTIAKVEFYHGATLLGTANNAPYSYTWSNVAAGSYSLTARAYDNQGASTASAPVAVTVNAGVAHGVYYIYADHLNTPRVITDNANKVVWRWDSDPFGSDAANEDPDGDGVGFGYNLRFPGQYYDKETGLHQNYFRDGYMPDVGRYSQSDPIGLRGGINTYLYSSANPIMRTDARGLFDSVHHDQATAKGADAAGFGGDLQSWLIPQVSGVDFLPGSQDPANSDWHAMRDPSWSTSEAENRWSKIVNGLDCDWSKLPLVLHAAQDSCARGHKGFQPWDGHITTEHLSGDVKPTPEEMRCAINITQKILEEFKKRCTCMK